MWYLAAFILGTVFGITIMAILAINADYERPMVIYDYDQRSNNLYPTTDWSGNLQHEDDLSNNNNR